MTKPVILSAVRSAVATAYKGSLVNMPPESFARTVLENAIARAGLAPEQVGDVVFAESLYGGGVIARHAALEAGLVRTAGMAVNRHCAGSLTATGVAAASVLSGMEDVVIAGGVQSSSLMPAMRQRNPRTNEMEEAWLPPTHPDRADAPNLDMSITVGWNTAQEAGVDRAAMDAWAFRSHQRAIAAIDAGHFADEIVPVTAYGPDGQAFIFAVDEHPRRNSSLEKLATLKPLHPEIQGFSITAGNSSGINDGASALAISTDTYARINGLTPIATILGWAAIGIDARLTGMAVIDVVGKLMQRTGRDHRDVAVWEINEAYATVPIAAVRALGLDEDNVNVSGSGCSIGHPVAASGGRMIATLINDLKRRGGGLGVAAMCAGGGQAGAVLIEV
ncbi:MAG: thiolase family protein [Sphingobium sp.]